MRRLIPSSCHPTMGVALPLRGWLVHFVVINTNEIYLGKVGEVIIWWGIRFARGHEFENQGDTHKKKHSSLKTGGNIEKNENISA